MYRLNSVKKALAVLVTAAFVVSGCRPAGLFAPLGQAPLGGGDGYRTESQAPRTATLLVRVKWPERDLPGFTAAAIPTSTNALVIKVSGSGRPDVVTTITRPAGPATDPVVTKIDLPEGTDLTLDVKAYRESSPTPGATNFIAHGTTPIAQALAGKLVNVSVTLDAKFAPKITKLSAYGSLTGENITITGLNFGTGDTPIKVKFGGKDGLEADPATLNRKSDTEIVVRVPAQGVTGPLVVVADGIPSTEDANFWVMEVASLKIKVQGNFDGTILPAGATASIDVVKNIAYRLPQGMDEASASATFGAEPGRVYTLVDAAKAEVTVGTGLVDVLKGKASGSTKIKASIGLVQSNEFEVTILKGFTLATVAGNGTGIGDGGSALTAELKQPMGLAVLEGGDLLVVDQGHNRIRKLGATVSTFAGNGVDSFLDGPAADAKFSSPAAVAVDASGSVYVADFGNNRIRKIAEGQVSTVAGTGTDAYLGDGGLAVNASLNYPQGLAVTPGGNLVIADTYNHRIRIYAPAESSEYGFFMPEGTIHLLAGTGTAGHKDSSRQESQFNKPVAVAIDATGSIYVADSSNNRVRKISVDGQVTTVAGNGGTVFDGDAGDALAASIEAPLGIAVDASGSLYVSDSGHRRIRMITPDASISTIAGTGADGSEGDGATAKDAQLSIPGPLALGDDALYISDFGASRVRKIVLSTGVISTVAGLTAADGTPALETQLAGPLGVVLDPAGKLVIVDTDRNLVRRLNDNDTQSIVAGTGVARFDGDGGAPKQASFNGPASATYDSQGVLYVVDVVNKRIRAIGAGSDVQAFGLTIAAGKVATVAGGGASSGTGALKHSFSEPVDIAFTAGGDLLVTDATANRVYQVARSGGAISVFAGNGSPGHTGDNSSASGATLQSPRGIAIDADGSVLIVDGQNHAIRRVKDGIITTVAGNGSPNFTGDNGVAVNAQLNGPWDVVTDGTGGYYVTDSGNAAIRWVSPGGIITTVAGTPKVTGFLGDGLAALQGRLFEPKGLVRSAASGVIFFADTGNHRIRKLTPQ